MAIWALLSLANAQIQEIPSIGFFSLFSVDSGDQKIKTFCTFFGFSTAKPSAIYFGVDTKNNYGRDAAAAFFWATGITWPGKQLYLDTKNSFGREAAAFFWATGIN